MSLFRKVFRIGALPPALAAVRDEGGALFVAEHVTVKATGELRTPQRYSMGFSSLHGGALVITADRVLASVGRTIILDDRPGATDPAGSAAATLRPDGLHLVVDVARVVEGGTGRLEVHVRTLVPDEVLAAVPAHEWTGWFARPDPARGLRRI